MTISDTDKLGAIKDIQFVINKKKINDDLLVLGGDNLFEFNLQYFINYFKEKHTSIIALYDVKNKEAVKPNATLLFEIPEFEHPTKNPRLLMPTYLKGNENKLIIIGRELKELKIGQSAVDSYNRDIERLQNYIKNYVRSTKDETKVSANGQLYLGILAQLKEKDLNVVLSEFFKR